MGLDELADNKKEEQKNNKVEGLKEELGVEDKEDMQELDSRLSKALQMIITMDRRIEELEGRLAVIERALSDDGD